MIVIRIKILVNICSWFGQLHAFESAKLCEDQSGDVKLRILERISPLTASSAKPFWTPSPRGRGRPVIT